MKTFSPVIARELPEDGIRPLFPYKISMTKEGFFRKYEYVNDEYYHCYICPENHTLSYHTTNRDGYREYKLRENMCWLSQSSHMYGKQRTYKNGHPPCVGRIYGESGRYPHTLGSKQIYELRKETIEKIFGTAKELHGFRYTQYTRKTRMEMKAGPTFACINLKKLARILAQRERSSSTIHNIWRKIKEKSLLAGKVVLEIIFNINFVYSLKCFT